MQIAVIGAGITGVTTAHALAADGHTVTVFERRSSVAAEGSFAQSALCASWAPLPWGLPGLQRRLLARWLTPDGVLRLGSPAAALRWGWWWQRWQAARQAAAKPRDAALLALARSSQERLAAVQRAPRHSFEQSHGLLLLVRNPKQAHRVRTALAAELRESTSNLSPRWLDPEACYQMEPHLSAHRRLAGGLHLADSGVGNPRQLAHLLKAAAQSLGGRFAFDTDVRSVQAGDKPSVETSTGGTTRFDAVVVCAGAGSAQLLARAGLALPFQTVQRFAWTAPLAFIDGHGTTGPRHGIVDASSGIAIARIGQRLRVTGVTVCGGTPQRHLPWAMATLGKALEAMYPGAAVARHAQQWGGARALLPDGAPVIGPCALRGVWLNTGHGGTGWSVACGSALLLAQWVAGKPIEEPMAWLSAARLRGQ